MKKRIVVNDSMLKLLKLSSRLGNFPKKTYRKCLWIVLSFPVLVFTLSVLEGCFFWTADLSWKRNVIRKTHDAHHLPDNVTIFFFELGLTWQRILSWEWSVLFYNQIKATSFYKPNFSFLIASRITSAYLLYSYGIRFRGMVAVDGFFFLVTMSEWTFS